MDTSEQQEQHVTFAEPGERAQNIEPRPTTEAATVAETPLPDPATPSAPMQSTAMEQEQLPQLPAKRPYEAMSSTLDLTEDGIHLRPAGSDGSPALGYGPPHRRHFVAYTTDFQRQQDVADINKDPTEPDTSLESDSVPESAATIDKPKSIRAHQRRARQEAKQLDREIPWREILKLPPSKVEVPCLHREGSKILDGMEEHHSTQPSTSPADH